MAEYTLQALDLVLRRRAAFMTLSEVFEGDQLMHAMWMLEERDQSANKFAFIGFVGITAELLGIKSSIVTTLYPKLNNNLELTGKDLPEDPMPQMLEYQGRKKDNKPSTVNQENTATTKQIIKAAKKTQGTPEMNVFAALISSIVSESGYPDAESYSAFNITVKDEINSAKLENSNREQILSWIDTFNLKAFKNNIAAEELSTMVHCLYIALCDAQGPVKADMILIRAIKHASKIAAAKSFSPKKFL